VRQAPGRAALTLSHDSIEQRLADLKVLSHEVCTMLVDRMLWREVVGPHPAALATLPLASETLCPGHALTACIGRPGRAPAAPSGTSGRPSTTARSAARMVMRSKGLLVEVVLHNAYACEDPV
jgi:hypothetical protein